MLPVNEIWGSIAVGLLGTAGVGSIFVWMVQGLVRKIEKIVPLEQRIVVLEVDAIKHNKTAEEVIRLQEQVRFLTDMVRRIEEKLNNG